MTATLTACLSESMNIYGIIKYISNGKTPTSLKLMGLWGLYLLRRRLVGVFFDPVLACNLRCQMCYFSDPCKRQTLHGTITDQDLELLEKQVFPHAMKLQIGCGAEPTLYPRLAEIIQRGKRAGIPYISLTTNGQLLATGRVDMEELIKAGLDEITLSLHGTNPETYNNLMTGGDFEKFTRLLHILATIKKSYNNKPLLRINFTVNSLNINDIKPENFWPLWQRAGILPDIIQIRPVQNLGQSAWTDFDLTPIKEKYHSTIGPLITRCKELGITILAPSFEAIDNVATPQQEAESIIEDITYCYVSPDGIYKPDFNISQSENIPRYLRRKNTGRRLLKAIFNRKGSKRPNVSKKLNYTVK